MDLRSRMRSLYPGACGFGDMRSRLLYTRDKLVHARGNMDRFRATAVNESVARGRIHEGHKRFRDDPQGRQIATNDSVWLLIHSILCALRQ